MFSNHSQPLNSHRDVAILQKMQKLLNDQVQGPHALLELDVDEVAIWLVIRNDPATRQTVCSAQCNGDDGPAVL